MTKPQLEKELKKTQNMLKAALTELEKVRNSNAPKQESPLAMVAMDVKQTQPQFQRVIENLTSELKQTQDYIYTIHSKLDTFLVVPNGIGPEKTERLNGIIGVLDELNDIASQNTKLSSQAFDRLRDLVG